MELGVQRPRACLWVLEVAACTGKRDGLKLTPKQFRGMGKTQVELERKQVIAGNC